MPSDSLILDFAYSCWVQYGQLPPVVQVVLPASVWLVSWVLYNYFIRLRGVPGPLLARLGIPGELAYHAIKLEWVSLCK